MPDETCKEHAAIVKELMEYNRMRGTILTEITHIKGLQNTMSDKLDDYKEASTRAFIETQKNLLDVTNAIGGLRIDLVNQAVRSKTVSEQMDNVEKKLGDLVEAVGEQKKGITGFLNKAWGALVDKFGWLIIAVIILMIVLFMIERLNFLSGILKPLQQ